MKKAFTLTELLVVVIIVGILAAVAMPMFSGMIIRANFAQVLVDVAQCDTIFRAYRADHGYNSIPGYSSGNIDGYGAATGIKDLPSNSGPFEYEFESQNDYWKIIVKAKGEYLCSYCDQYIPPDVQDKIWEVYGSHPWGKAVSDSLKAAGWQVDDID